MNQNLLDFGNIFFSRFKEFSRHTSQYKLQLSNIILRNHPRASTLHSYLYLEHIYIKSSILSGERMTSLILLFFRVSLKSITMRTQAPQCAVAKVDLFSPTIYIVIEV